MLNCVNYITFLSTHIIYLIYFHLILGILYENIMSSPLPVSISSVPYPRSFILFSSFRSLPTPTLYDSRSNSHCLLLLPASQSPCPLTRKTIRHFHIFIVFLSFCLLLFVMIDVLYFILFLFGSSQYVSLR